MSDQRFVWTFHETIFSILTHNITFFGSFTLITLQKSRQSYLTWPLSDKCLYYTVKQKRFKVNVCGNINQQSQINEALKSIY